MFHGRSYWLLLLVTCYGVLLLIAQANSLRIPKEDLRVKSKCHTNVTHSETSTASRCIALSHPYCLDIRLPYNATILPEYLPDITLRSFDEISNFLERWRGVKKLPKCWPVLQMALCSVLMPQCEEDPATGRVLRYYRPNVDICNDLVNKDECRFLARQLEDWPSIFNCSDTNIYARNCTNELRVLKFSGSTGQAQCQHPLVASRDESTWFKDIRGCAVHCKFPVTSSSEQSHIMIFIGLLCLAGLFTTLAAFILFNTNRATSKSRIDKVIKRCTWCHLLIYIGWSLQFLFGSDLACGQGGSTLYGLPLVANACVLSFLLTYLPSLASLFWCAHLGKLCHMKLVDKQKEESPGNAEIDRTLSLFNYGIPLTLFVCVAFLGHIDGRGLHGICTVGQQSLVIKSIFVFAPTLIGTLYGNYFFMRIITMLWFEKGTTVMNSKLPSRVDESFEREQRCSRGTFVRITALAVLMLLQLVFETANYAYEHLNQARWLDSVDNYIGCQLNLNNLEPVLAMQEPVFVSGGGGGDRSSACSIGSKTLIILDYLEIFAKLTLGIVIASWAFNECNYRGLRWRLVKMLEVKPEQTSVSDNDDDHDDDDDDDDVDEDDHVGGGDGADQQVPEVRQRCLSIGTPSSLGSTALPSGLNSENSSIQHNNVFRSKKHRSRRGKTSRDVVNDCKQRKQLQQMQQQHQQPDLLLQPPVPDQTSLMAAHMLMMMDKMRDRFNPPNLIELHADSVQQPQFHHGICNYTPAQDESQHDSAVQQEESKT